jgi:hypothetical protein
MKAARVPARLFLRMRSGWGPRRAAYLTTLAALGIGTLVLPASAAAWEEITMPEYSISVVEGETTVPEDPILHTSGYVHLPHTNHVQVTLRLVHNGLTVAQDTESNGYAGFSQVPQVGDIVYLESPTGNVVGSDVYDGLPSMDPTVCAGSANLSGQRSAGEEVEGSYETLVVHPSYVAHRPGGQAQVTSLIGSSFGGNFLAPLALGETVNALERLRTTLAGGATFTYSSENVRPVGACPVPPVPPPPPPAPALQGSIFKLVRTTIHKLLHSGWLTEVTINQPGTIVERLYLSDGKLPAYAASRHGRRHSRKPPALLLARGSAHAAAAGKVHVVLRATSQGRRVLAHVHSVRAVLITTLYSKTGSKLSLARRSLTLHG